MANALSRLLPPDPEEMNNQRARWAAETLETFEHIAGERASADATEEEQQELAKQNLSDFLADLAHYCDRAGIDLQGVLHNASLQYEEETEGEGTQLTQYRQLEAVWRTAPARSTSAEK
jgi:NTP pyrophosphatase (non-canonical NTP hydrolase)